jgi:DNA-binding transcriptional MocR family regulator
MPVGAWLALHLHVCRRCPYLRLSFANPPPEELEEGVRRLAAVLRRLQQQRQVQEGG